MDRCWCTRTGMTRARATVCLRASVRLDYLSERAIHPMAPRVGIAPHRSERIDYGEASARQDCNVAAALRESGIASGSALDVLRARRAVSRTQATHSRTVSHPAWSLAEASHGPASNRLDVRRTMNRRGGVSLSAGACRNPADDADSKSAARKGVGVQIP